MRPRAVTWAWRRDSRVVHLGVRGRGVNQLATYCNRWWIQDHVLPAWSSSPDLPTEHRDPCLLCIGWLRRNGGSGPLLTIMAELGRTNYPNLPRARHLEAV